MCFNAPMSLAFTVAGLLIALKMHQKFPDKPTLWIGVFYFCLMELLQFVTLISGVIDDCESQLNKILTWIGIFHILLQPYFISLMSGAFAKTDSEKTRAEIYRRLTLFGAFFLFLSIIFSPADNSYSENEVNSCLLNRKMNKDWIRGERVCTRMGVYHLAWSAPMAAPSYFLPNSFIHFFVMFVPYFLQARTVSTGVLFVLSGPVLATLVTDNVNEAASIWCFFSIAQIAVISGRLLLPKEWRFGTGKKGGKTVAKKTAKKTE